MWGEEAVGAEQEKEISSPERICPFSCSELGRVSWGAGWGICTAGLPLWGTIAIITIIYGVLSEGLWRGWVVYMHSKLFFNLYHHPQKQVFLLVIMQMRFVKGQGHMTGMWGGYKPVCVSRALAPTPLCFSYASWAAGPGE